MKPTYALNLSTDGIGLWHRAPGGWHLVDEIALDDEELGSKLEVLRKTAAGLEQSGVTTKLIIPNSQILYRTIDVIGETAGEQATAVIAAMDGATPYKLEDLAIDWQPLGNDQIALAAVARETLAEAEAFAVDKNFNPVSFVAVPPDDAAFPTEPFFGETLAAGDILNPGERVERDINPVGVDEIFISARARPPEPLLLTEIDNLRAKGGLWEPGEDGETKPVDVAPAGDPEFTPVYDDPRAAPVVPEDGIEAKEPVQAAPVAPPSADPEPDLEPDPEPSPDEAAIPAPVIVPADAAVPIPAATPANTPAPVPLATRQSEPDPKPRMAPGVVAGAFAPSMSPRAQIVIGAILILFALLLVASVVMRETVASLIGLGDEPTVASSEPPAQPRLNTRISAPELTLNAPDDPAGTLGEQTFLMATLAETAPAPLRAGRLDVLVMLDPPPTSGLGATLIETALPLPAEALAIPDVEQGTPELDPPPKPAALAVDLSEMEPATQGISDFLAFPLMPMGLSLEPGITGPDELAPQRAHVSHAQQVPDTPVFVLASLSEPVTDFEPIAAPSSALAILSALAPPANLADLPDGLPGLPQNLPDTLPEPTADVPPPIARAPSVLDVAPPVSGDPSILPDPEPVIAFAPDDPILPLLSPMQRNPVAAAVSPILPPLRPLPPPVAAADVERALLAANTDGTPDISLIRPRKRPANVMSRQIASAAPATAPSANSGTTVARRATQDGVLRLSKVNLIGVFGKSNDRSALVRLPSGRVVKVQVGDRLDGGQVIAISSSGLTYAKNGRNIGLAMPLG